MNFREEIKRRRGIVTKRVDGHIAQIEINGTPSFKEWMLESKLIGLSKASQIASLEDTEQNEFVVWACLETRNQNAVDLKIMELTDEV